MKKLLNINGKEKEKLLTKIKLDSKKLLNFFKKKINFIRFFQFLILILFLIFNFKDTLIKYLFKPIWCLANLCLYGDLKIVNTLDFFFLIKILLLVNFWFLYLSNNTYIKKFLQKIWVLFFLKVLTSLKFTNNCGLKLVIKLVLTKIKFFNFYTKLHVNLQNIKKINICIYLQIHNKVIISLMN